MATLKTCYTPPSAMEIIQHSAFHFVQFWLLLTWVAWILLGRDVTGKFLGAWTLMALLAVFALPHIPEQLKPYLALPFFVSVWSIVATLIASVIIREFGREFKLSKREYKLRFALFCGTFAAFGGGILSWTLSYRTLSTPLLIASFILLGYCARSNRLLVK